MSDRKKCEKFCKTTFLKERERVESVVAKENGVRYVPVARLEKQNKPLAKTLKGAYVSSCKQIYCNKGCAAGKGRKDFVASIEKDKPRKERRLQKQGAVSGCRDLAREFPKYYDKKKI
jgi:hypothetical protein